MLQNFSKSIIKLSLACSIPAKTTTTLVTFLQVRLRSLACVLHFGRLPSLPHKYWASVEKIVGAKRSSLLRQSVNYGAEKS